MPNDTRVYAVGDVHGELTLLRKLHGQIQADAAASGARRKVVVHLGDYVDRGMMSKQVLDYLIAGPLPEFETVYLLGNHDHWFLSVLDDPLVIPNWLANGGQATLLSYGVSPRSDLPEAQRFVDLQQRLAAAVPKGHRRFIDGCRLYHVEGDYAFVHAGVRPGSALEEQDFEDLLWIREEFLSSRADLGYVVVHGHTVVKQPEATANRISIDTGAYATGRLTALALEGAERSFLHT